MLPKNPKGLDGSITRATLDAATAFCLYFGAHWRRASEPERFAEIMTLDEKVTALIEQPNHVAYQLLLDDRRDDWREAPEDFEEAMQVFRNTFEKVVRKVSAQWGPPSYIEREYSGEAPDWAPMGLYADWVIDDKDNLLCVFMGGDGNPEDPLILLAGRATQGAKSESTDPWDWQWIE